MLIAFESVFMCLLIFGFPSEIKMENTFPLPLIVQKCSQKMLDKSTGVNITCLKFIPCPT